MKISSTPSSRRTSNVGKPRVGEESDVGQGLIEAAAKGGDDDDLFWVQLDGTVDGQFEIRLVLIVRDRTRSSHHLP